MNKGPEQFIGSTAFRGLQGRTGRISAPRYEGSSVPNMNLMASRLNQHGGQMQEDRMIRDKRRSLDKATLYSYQRAFVRKNTQDNFGPEDDMGEAPAVRALINPNKLKQDYDDKILSIGFEHDFHSGDIFEWVNTGTHWIIYLQDLDELAYFRGDIRRCSYQIEWEDETGRHKTYCAVRGPVETKINYIQKHGISVDTPNHSVNILMPKNDYTLKYFKRYTKFYLQDGTDEHKVCWRVEAVDWISMPGVLEINGVEYYTNETEDDVDAGIVGAKLKPVQNPNGEEDPAGIIGETFIKPKKQYIYSCIDKSKTWSIDSHVPVQSSIDKAKNLVLTWTASYSGQFDIHYGDFTKTIVVESLF